MHTTLLDKFYHIVTTDEITDLPIFKMIHIINRLFDFTDNQCISLFYNGAECKAFIEYLNREGNTECYKEETELINSLVELDTLCLLENYVETMPNGDIVVTSNIKHKYGYEYEFILEIMNERILSKIPDLKKALKKLLKEKAIRNAIRNHVIRNPLSIVED